MEGEDRLLNIAEAAKMVGVHKNTLRAWADRGLVAHVRLPSGYRRFRVPELRRVAREMEQGTHEEQASKMAA